MRRNTSQYFAHEALAEGDLARALGLLEGALVGVRGYGDWLEIGSLFEQVPKELILNEPDWASVYSATLVGLRAERELLEFSSEFLSRHSLPETAPVLADRSWALLNQERYSEAGEALEQALPHLEGWRLGVAWRRVAQVRYNLGGDWQAAFAKAYTYLTGRLKGIALNEEGACWQLLDEHPKARARWHEALALLEGDTYFQAWVNYALGQSYLRDQRPEAEEYFLQAVALTHSKAASAFRSRSYHGLGNFRRNLGEWARAEAAYQKAIETAEENDDLRVAYWSLGRCYRLQGKYDRALQTLHHSLKHFTSEASPVQTEVAAVWLAMNHEAEARQALEKAGHLHTNALWLDRILQAELARRQGDGVSVLQGMRDLPMNTLLLREELVCWPDLFQAIRLMGQPIPQPIPYPSQTVVKVQTLGVLKVWVNERPVPLGPTTKIGELLVLLLEHQGEASSEALIEALLPESKAKRQHQSLWHFVHELREVLGWSASVQAFGKTYRLDPQAQWVYDLTLARQQKKAHAPFLKGVYSNWALEVAQEVDLLREWGESDSGLN